MLVEVYGGRTELYLVHGLNAQQLANAAYNVEVASWLLGRRQNPMAAPCCWPMKSHRSNAT
jgi:hypothetical protein